MNDSLPAGWYTDDAGNRKYWTGSEWVLPATDASTAEPSEEASLPRNFAEPLQGSQPSGSQSTNKKSAKKPFVAGAIALAVALAGGGAWYVMDQNAQAEAAQIQAEKAAAELKAKEEAEAAAKKEAEEEAAAAKAAADQEAALEEAAQELWDETVAEYVKDLEKLGMGLYDDSRKDGMLLDKVLEVQCQAAAGSNSVELGVSSTEYSCLAVTEKQDDGQSRGYGMKGLIDWNSGQMQMNWDF